MSSASSTPWCDELQNLLTDLHDLPAIEDSPWPASPTDGAILVWSQVTERLRDLPNAEDCITYQHVTSS